MTHIEALRLALEALESLQGGCTDSNDGTVEAITVWCPEVIDALRQAIEQAEKQEPVAWLSKGGKGIWFHEPDASLNATPLYTAPQRQPLTDEQKIKIVKDNTVQSFHGSGIDAWGIIDAVEAAHNIRRDDAA